MNDIGHWQCEFDFDPEQWYGFCYRLINNTTGQEYIGKKQFQSRNRVKVKGRKNRKIVFRQTNWKKYTSSSKYINEEIEEFGLERFTFIILSLHESKGSLVYAEIVLQITENVMREKMSDGTNRYYNRNVGSVKFIPPDETLLESQFKVSQTH